MSQYELPQDNIRAQRMQSERDGDGQHIPDMRTREENYRPSQWQDRMEIREEGWRPNDKQDTALFGIPFSGGGGISFWDERDGGLDRDRNRNHDRGKERDAQLIGEVQKAIVGEAHAYETYERLERLAPEPSCPAGSWNRIGQDELKHRRWFTMILQMLGGREPVIPPTALPTRYREGLRRAFADELESGPRFIRRLPLRRITR